MPCIKLTEKEKESLLCVCTEFIFMKRHVSTTFFDEIEVAKKVINRLCK